MSSLSDSYQTIIDLPCNADLSWDEYVLMCETLGCIFEMTKEDIAEWLADQVQYDYSINCQKEKRHPHGTSVQAGWL